MVFLILKKLAKLDFAGARVKAIEIGDSPDGGHTHYGRQIFEFFFIATHRAALKAFSKGHKYQAAAFVLSVFVAPPVISAQSISTPNEDYVIYSGNGDSTSFNTPDNSMTVPTFWNKGGFLTIPVDSFDKS
jgi:hypothetical protein